MVGLNTDDLVIEVRNAALERVGVLLPDQVSSLNAEVPFNGVGKWTLVLAADHPLRAHLEAPGGGLVVSDRPTGLTLFSGPVNAPEQASTPLDVKGSITYNGITDEHILDDSLAWPDPTVSDVATIAVATDNRTGPSEDLIHQYVSANIGPTAVGGRKRPKLLLSGNQSRGQSVSVTARFNNLLGLCRSLAGPDKLGFRVVQVGANLELQTYMPTDLAASLSLSVETGEVTSSRVSRTAPELTRAIVGGKGIAATRPFREYSTAESELAEREWARRIERYIDQSSSEIEDDLARAGLEALVDGGRTVVSARFEPSENLRDAFLSEWTLGDRVAVRVDTNTYVAAISAVVLKLDTNGLRIGALLGDPYAFKDEYEKLVKFVEKLDEEATEAALDDDPATGTETDESLTELDVALQELQQHLDETADELALELAEAEAAIAAANLELDQLQTDLEANEAALGVLELSLSTLNTDLDNLDVNLALNVSETAAAALAAANAQAIGEEALNDASAASIKAKMIGVYQLDAANIAAGSIQTSHLVANSINGDRITAGTLDAAKITAGSIGTDRMTANSINGDRITAGTLNADKIVAGTIGTDRMTANTINGDRIAANTLHADKITAFSIYADKIATDAITSAKISAGAITATKIATGTITALQIQGGTITSTQIANGAIGTTQIAGGAITTDKIDAGAITATKIATGAIDATKIVAGSITSDLIASGTINTDRLKTESTGKIHFGSGVSMGQPVAIQQLTVGPTNISSHTINFSVTSAGTVTTNSYLTAADLYTTGPSGSASDDVNIGSGNRLYRVSSSRRFKSDIVDAEPDVEAILQLPIRRYTHALGEEGNRELGFIAEEADELGLGDWVTRNAGGEIHGFSYSRFCVGLLAVCQKQQEQIQSLTERLDAAGV